MFASSFPWLKFVLSLDGRGYDLDGGGEGPALAPVYPG